MKQHLLPITALFFTVLLLCQNARAADPYATVDIQSGYTSNVYLTSDVQSDITIEPDLEIGVDIDPFWTMGYIGQIDIFMGSPDLLYHSHEAFLFMQPTWGPDRENSFYLDLHAFTGKNTNRYASLNLLRPGLDMALQLEPVRWFRWSMGAESMFRWFYDDPTASTFDVFVRTDFSLVFRTRTTLTPRLTYGHRLHTRPTAAIQVDNQDDQIVSGVHVSQGLWDGAGLQLEYANTHMFEESSFIRDNLESIEFNYIGDDFLFSGHAGALTFKQVYENGFSFGFSGRMETREYAGWANADSEGNPTGTFRSDQRLLTDAWLRHTLIPIEEAPRQVPSLSFGLDYSYVRQWSNNLYYDTDCHMLYLSMGAGW